jgi:glycosyltransferase involved in cell wall biosynthesis
VSAKSRIVIDATPVLDVSGFRGIGRYVRDLLLGLEQTRDEWGKTLDIRAVTELGWRGHFATDADLGRALDTVESRRGSAPPKTMGRLRRASLGQAARGAAVLHFTEALGMPLRRRTRWVLTCHDLIPLRMPEHYIRGGWLARLARWGEDFLRYQRSDRLIAISRRTRDDLVELLRIPPDKIDVVPTGIDLDQWCAVSATDDEERRRALGIGERPYLIYVGQGDARKGIDEMLRALAELDGIELVWAAKLSPADLAFQKERARALGVADRVRFPGFVADADLAALYRGALAHPFLSKLEGFGLSVAEALACGCPVLVVRDSGADEVAGDAGFVLAPEDVVAAAEIVRRLAASPELRVDRARLGVARAARFDRRAMARAYVESWRRALG